MEKEGQKVLGPSMAVCRPKASIMVTLENSGGKTALYLSTHGP